MNVVLYIAAAAALVTAAAVAVTRCPVRALRWLASSLLASYVVAYAAGAALAAAAAAVLPVAIVALASRLPDATAIAAREGHWLAPRAWVVPITLSVLVLAELGYVLAAAPGLASAGAVAARADVPLAPALVLVAALFTLGLLIVLVRRGVVLMLMGLAVMLNAAGLALALGGSRGERAEGPILFVLALVAAVAVAGVGVVLALRMVRRRGGSDVVALLGLRR